MERGFDAAVATVNRDIYPEDKYPYGQWAYQHYFETHFERMVKWFGADVETCLPVMYTKGSPEGMGKVSPAANIGDEGGMFASEKPDPAWRNIPRSMLCAEEEYLQEAIAAFKHSSFWGPLARYSNHERNEKYFETAKNDGTLHMPALFVAGSWDSGCDVVHSTLAEPARRNCTNLTETSVEAGHWVVQEKPEDVNAAIVRCQDRATSIIGFSHDQGQSKWIEREAVSGCECLPGMSYVQSQEGMTRREYLRQEYDEQRRELDSAMSVLAVLRHGSDREATETLARIRLGQTLQEANDEIESSRASQNQEDESMSSVGDEQSTAESPSTQSFDHQGPYPNLDRTRASFSTTSAIPPSSYWTQGPPQMHSQAYTASSSRRPSQQQQQQQQRQQGFGTMDPQNFASWPSPLSSEPQSAVSDWSGIGVQQFEQFDFGTDGDMHYQPDDSASGGPRSTSNFGHGRTRN
ncbi:hypothetical protein PRZ48_010164 [Zasmidium cellare]|uniref:Uncharacterized protein n=1 Tax=Zasmidium cellare TaxID=395010 RepID=A0ABR0EED7_ZASCE|nr:hypothetical protein PRZ48_010164 [Zasmidium cellare]